MKASEAISLVDRLRPNQYDSSIKIQWLLKLDGQIFDEIIRPRTCGIEFLPSEDLERELLVPFPYGEDVYNNYLQAMIDRENGETAKYNQSITLFHAAYSRYRNWFNREKRPLRKGRFIF